MDISVNTKLVPVIGKPMGQSLSARMGNRIYESTGKDFYRFPIEAEREDLEAILNGLRCMNVARIGITKPYKIEVMKYLDEIDGLAQKIGAVNSVKVENKRLIGRNMDGLAFLRSLDREVGCKLEDTNFFCFGAGGAGRAICCTLADRGAKSILVADKLEDAARALADDINTKFAPIAREVPFSDAEELKRSVQQADVVMNATGLGMYPNLTATPVHKEWLHAGQVAFDATYNPSRTQFLKDAEEAGCRIFNGKGMIIFCGMMGYEEGISGSVDYEIWSQVFDELLREYAVPVK